MYGENDSEYIYSVYMHVFPNDKVYIGITSMEPEKRWLKDGYGYKNQTRVYRAIKKYGWNNIEHIIVAQNVNIETAKNMEVDLIALYNSTNKKHGYNSDLGGNLHSKETREKISKARMGQHPTEEARNKMSESRKGKPKSEEHKRKIGESNRGKILSDETKEKIRQKATGRHQDTVNDPRNMPVFQYDMSTKQLVGVYLSISKASRDTGLSKNHISECAKDKRRQEGGCIWVYENMMTDEYVQNRLEKAKFHGMYKPVVVYSNGDLDSPMYFASTAKAAEYLNINKSTIKMYLNNNLSGYYIQRISVDEYLNNI